MAVELWGSGKLKLGEVVFANAEVKCKISDETITKENINGKIIRGENRFRIKMDVSFANIEDGDDEKLKTVIGYINSGKIEVTPYFYNAGGSATYLQATMLPDGDIDQEKLSKVWQSGEIFKLSLKSEAVYDQIPSIFFKTDGFGMATFGSGIFGN